MAKRKQKKGKGGTKGTSKRESREIFSYSLHRATCRWDVLVYELSQRLEKRLRALAAVLSSGPLKFRGGETEEVAWMLSRVIDVLVQQRSGQAVRNGEAWDLAALDAEGFKALQPLVNDAFARALRKYAEDEMDFYLPKPSRDLDSMAAELAKAAAEFLAEHTSGDGDLRDCVTAPATPDDAYFPPNDLPVIRSSGDARRDLYELGVVIRDDDDAATVKGKLLAFARHDPWLFAELRRYIEDDFDAGAETGKDEPPIYRVNELTDEFLFRATRLEGKTPVELLLDRQIFISEIQNKRLGAWVRETFSSIFRVESVGLDFLLLSDLRDGNEYRAYASRPEVLASIPRGTVMATRIVPWDRHWTMSGMQSSYDNRTPAQLRDLRLQLLMRGASRPVDPTDPQTIKAMAVQKSHYDVWVHVHGSDELLFNYGEDADDAIARFQHYLTHESIDPETGKLRREMYIERHGHAPPDVPTGFPTELLDAHDVGLVFHPVTGLSILADYGLFLSAFRESAPLTPEQIEVVWSYLSDDTIEYWLFQRVAERYPERVEAVLRDVLRDKTFLIDRDLEPVLRKFKGEQMRVGLKPAITVFDDKEVQG